MQTRSHVVEKGSPDWLMLVLERARCRSQEEVDRLFAGRGGDWALAALSLLLGASLFVFRDGLLRLSAVTNPFHYRALAYITPIVIPALLFPFVLFSRAPRSLYAGRLAVFGASLIFLYAFSRPAEQQPLLLSLAIGFLVPLMGFWLSFAVPSGWRLVSILGFTLLASGLLAVARARIHGDWGLLVYVLFSLPVMPLTWLAEEEGVSAGTFRPFSLAFLSYYFSSLNLNYFLAAQSDDLKAPGEAKEIFLLGVQNLIVGFVCVGAATPFDPGGLLNAHGYGTYLFYFFGTWGILRIAVGIGQLLGFPLPSPFYYPLLATNPVIHWRRWNTYFYRWYRTFIFFPTVRRTNSLLLAMVFIFCMNYYLHVAQQLFLPFAVSAPNPLLRNFLVSRLYFFSGHAALIYTCFRTARFWPSGKSRWGWLGVLATNLAMMLIHLMV